MELIFAWICAGTGIVGSTLACFSAGRFADCTAEHESYDKRELYAGALLILVVTIAGWLVSLRSTGPFSSGQSLGTGFLTGGAAALIALLESRRTGIRCSESSQTAKALAVVSMSFFAVFVSSLIFVLNSGYPQNAMLGLAIGACMGAIVSRLLDSGRTQFFSVLTDVFAVTATLLAAGTILSVMHFDDGTGRIWWSLPIIVGAISSAATFAGIQVFGSGSNLRLVPAVLVAAAASFVLYSIYGYRVTGGMELLKIAVASTVIWALIVWQAEKATGQCKERAVEASAAVLVLVLAFVVAAFKLWSGLGIAIGLIAASVAILPALALSSRISTMVLGAQATAVCVVLYRLFIEYYKTDIGRGNLTVHYTMIGAMASVVVAAIVLASLTRNRRILSVSTKKPLCQVLLIGTLGLFTALFPLLLMLIWNIKSVLGLVFGVIFMQAALVLALQVAEENIAYQLCKLPVILLGIQLVSLQFIGPILTTDITRAGKIWVLAISVVVFLVWNIVLERKAAVTCETDL